MKVVITLAAAGVLAACSSSTPNQPAPSPSVAPTSTSTPTQPPTTPSPTPTATPVPTAPPALAIPAGFTAMSATFVSASTGFVLGSYPCGAAGDCLLLLRTSDTGHTWSIVPAPPTHPSQAAGSGVRAVRFADAQDGWVFADELWATHDGGAHWRQPALPGVSNASVQSLEAGAGLVHATVLSNNGLDVDSSPVGSDHWTRDTTIQIGAGPVPHGQVVLSGNAGWAMEVDRTVIGGARLTGGTWSGWTPPCSSVSGPATLGAGTTTRLVAVCVEGVWSTPQGVHVWFSGDGGSSFQRVAAALPLQDAGQIAMSPSGTVVVGDASKLVLSANGGATWSTVYTVLASTYFADLGFTTASQGIVVAGGKLLMTFDGGHHWNPVSFTAA